MTATTAAPAAAFTIAEVQVYAQILDACINQHRVKWSPDGDNILEGVMRSLPDFRVHKDARDYQVRISGTFEHFLPITEVARLIGEHMFFIYPR